MAEQRLELVKVGYNKVQYVKTIDTSFNELGTTTTLTFASNWLILSKSAAIDTELSLKSIPSISSSNFSRSDPISSTCLPSQSRT